MMVNFSKEQVTLPKGTILGVAQEIAKSVVSSVAHDTVQEHAKHLSNVRERFKKAQFSYNLRSVILQRTREESRLQMTKLGLSNNIQRPRE
jgi:hypothetical protein